MTTPVSERLESRESRRRDDDLESVEMIEETDDEGFDDESCDETRDARVRFKVGGVLRVNI